MMSLKIFLWIFFLFLFSVMVLINGCARHRVAIDKPSHPRGKGIYHVVEKHQTLFRICKTYGVDLKEVASLNGIADPGRIRTGQRIFIPGAKRVLKVEVYIEDVVEESGHQEKMAYKKMNFIWPVEGRLGDGFDETEGRRHMGIDISPPAGAAIKASGSGKVIYSGNTIRGYGNLIILRHSEEFVTIYGHNEANLVEEGEWVERGQVIGKVGQTGRATGPHLHFEIRKNNRAVDPLLFLK
ncbi:MAG: M23 family metallopeptidase [Thermodesulfobacteriota bacterium]|nr:M23 family metallopeptidase [Thermodesulfobacteriota bacterium]